MSAADLSLSKMKPLKSVCTSCYLVESADGFSNSLQSSMVTIHVGTKKRKQALYVHKDLICARSPFFKAALSNDWKEAQEGSVELPDDKDDIVTIYVQWLYRNQIFYKEEKDVKESYVPEMNRLIALYLLAEKFQDRDFQDAAIDAMIARIHSPYQGFSSFYPGADEIVGLYKNTSESSPVRRLMVDSYAWHANQDWGLMEDISSVPIEFLRDLTVALIKVRPIPGGVAPDKEQRHLHLSPAHHRWHALLQEDDGPLDLRGPPQHHGNLEETERCLANSG